ncbi:MAG TPA: SDR family oxidoreductase [Burkholderiales bacterium]|nr:SDR family oxidoreductase [Burkholderiales bacterium]
MRVLIFGGDGMLGHQLLRQLARKHETRATLRRPLGEYSTNLFSSANAVGGVDVRDADAVREALLVFRPDAVVNAAGIVKQRDDAEAEAASQEVNASFPQRLAGFCRETGAYLVHFSTDCVFSGRKGAYTEADSPDPVDLYGRSKLLGEVAGEGCLTLRTSMIGPELSRESGLLEWFLAQKGSVQGYRKAVFSGLTTLEQARVIERILAHQPRISGLFHLSAEPISKLDLLLMIKRRFGLNVEIVPDDRVVIDRSLDSKRFRDATGYRPPSWEQMVGELAGAKRGGNR